MLFSKASEYAVRTMLYLAEREPGSSASASEISQVYHVPETVLAEILPALSAGGLISRSGAAKDDYLLARDATDISIQAIVDAVEEPEPEIRMCVVGLDPCDDATPCPLHDHWTHDRSLVLDILEHQSLAELRDGMRVRREQQQQRAAQ